MKTITLTGKVVNKKTKEELPFAKVVPLDKSNKVLSKYGVYTKDDGSFTLKVPVKMVSVPSVPVPVPIPLADKFRVSFAGLGTREAFLIFFLKDQVGLTKEQAILFSFLFIYQYLLLVICGFIINLFTGRRINASEVSHEYWKEASKNT